MKNFTQAENVCNAIHGDSYFWLVGLKKQNGEVTETREDFVYKATLEAHLNMYDKQGYEAFVTVAAASGEGRTNKNITHTWALALDFDSLAPPEIKTNPHLLPTIIIQTSKGRSHLVWVLNNSIDADEQKQMLVGMADRLDADWAFAKCSQMIRLPGFKNSKYGTEVTLLEESDLTRVFSADMLRKAFDVDIVLANLDYSKYTPQLTKPGVKTNTHVVDDVGDALSHLRDVDDYSTWFKTLSALAALGEQGRVLAHEYSKGSEKYKQSEVDKKFDSCLKNPGHIGYIFNCAAQSGYKNPGFRRKAGTTELTEREFGRIVASGLRAEAVVLPTGKGSSESYAFFARKDSGFVPLSNQQKRALIEISGRETLKELTEKKCYADGSLREMSKKLGKNSSLEDIANHVGEALCEQSKACIVSDYPYLGTKNGTLNLITAALLPRKYIAFSAKSVNVAYNPVAEAPRFNKALAEIFQVNPELKEFFLDLMGYILTGLRTEQIFVIFWGPTASNGKNVLGDLMRIIFGSYANKMPRSAFMKKSHSIDGATPSLAQLEGTRFAIISEWPKGGVLDSALVKELTGDKAINVRDLYQANRDMPITFTPLLLTNFAPVVDNDDIGAWRRIKMIPFNHRFEGAAVNKHLGDELLKESEGVFRLVVDAAKRYQQSGLKFPACVTEMTKQQRDETDPIEAMLKEELIRKKPGAETALKVLYDFAYKSLRDLQPSLPVLSKQELKKAFKAQGYALREKGHLNYVVGVELCVETEGFKVPGLKR
jgi:P4 family phage/plasmid primase-like protien